MASNNNRIEPQDIINEDDIISSLKNIKDGLKELKEAIQGVAESQKVELKNIISTAGMEKASDRVNALVQALAALNTAYQQNENALRDVTQAQLRQTAADKNVAEARLANARAYTEENKAMSRRSSASRQQISDIETEDNARRLLDGTIKTNELSYNQLYAVYKKLSGQLKNMSADTIQQTEENRKLAAATKQVRDSMNEAMKAMGNYSLNVGKYHTAFDGLGYSIQQVMREVPSAINISQFFLAISNNIPMVVDQMKLFNQEQEDIKKQMEELVEGTKEYIELQNNQMSLGKKILSSIFSWQTALLAVLLLLRKLPEITGKIKEMIKGVAILGNEMKSTAATTLALSDAAKAYGQRVEELNLINSKIVDIRKGTDEWRSAIERVNEICHSNLNATTATVEEVKKVTDAYKEQARQIAINKSVADKIATSDVNKQLRSIAEGMANKRDYDALASLLGYKQGSKEYKELKDKLELKTGLVMDFSNNATRRSKVTNEINAAFPILSEDAYGSLQDLVKIVDDPDKSPKSPKSTESKKEYEDMWKEYMKVRSNLIEEAQERERAARNDEYEIEIKDAEKTYKKKLANLEAYAKQEGYTEEELAKKKKELKDQYDIITKSQEEELRRDLKEIDEKYALAAIKMEINSSEAIVHQIKRRVKTREDEVSNNIIVEQNIASLIKERSRLEAIDTQGIEEAEEKKAEAINKVTEAIEKQKNALKFDQQLKNYKNFWDMIGANGALEGVGGDDKKGFLQKLGIVGVTDDNAESVFDQWVTNASSALKDMSSELKSYLSDMLSSWSSFYEERAELAKADTDEAKSYWEQQKELQKEGYANEVDTAWATYQEKLKYQQQAEALSKQWASVSQYVSDVEAGANLAVAVSNLLKQFTAIPGVGLALGAGAVAALLKMWGTYKSQVKSVATYGEGGYEALVGGSHASGHDIDMGFNNKSGRRVHTEGGEGWAVFSRRAVGKYGHKVLGDMVSRANAGTLAIGALQGNERMNEGGMVMSGVSLEKIERLLGEIEKNGSSNTMVMADGTVVTRTGNSTKRIRR